HHAGGPLAAADLRGRAAAALQRARRKHVAGGAAARGARRDRMVRRCGERAAEREARHLRGVDEPRQQPAGLPRARAHRARVRAQPLAAPRPAHPRALDPGRAAGAGGGVNGPPAAGAMDVADALQQGTVDAGAVAQPGAAGAAVAAGVRRVPHNAAALLLAYVLPRLFTLGSVVVAARVLGAADFGAYSTAAAFAVLLSIVATLGMTPLLVREIAQAPGRAPALLAAAHAVKTASNVLMLALLFVLARYVLAYPTPVVAASLLLGISYAVGAYVENLAAWFQAVERMHVWTQASAAFGLVTGGLGLLLVLWTRSLAWFCAAPGAGQLAALAWLLARLPAEASRGGRVEAVGALRLVRALAPFAAAFVALTVYYKVDVLLLARWRDAAEVGLYAAAYKFVDVAHALALVAAGAVYPRLSRAAVAAAAESGGAGSDARTGRGGRASSSLPRTAARLSEWTLLATVPAAGVVFLLRAPLTVAIYGAAYAD